MWHIHNNKALTFGTLYTVVRAGLQAHRAGRKVNLDRILQHELMCLPLCLAKTDRSRHSSEKAVLANVLAEHVMIPPTVELVGPSSLLSDGQGLVISLRKPADVNTFDEYATKFAETVYQMGATFDRI